MKKEFSANVILLVGINLLVKPLYIFGIDRTVQNVVGPDVYGLYFALFNFTYLFYIINDFGLQNYSNRFVSQNREQVGGQLPNILGIKFFLFIGYYIVLFFAGWWLGYFPEHWKLLLLMGFNQALVALMFYLRANLSGLGHYRQDSLVSVLDRGLLIIMVGAMLLLPAWRNTFQIEWFILAQTVSLLISIAVLLAMVFPKATLTGLSFDVKKWKVILKASAPFALVIVLMTFYTRLDAVMIERMLPSIGKYETGVYASAYRLLDAFNMMGFLIAGLLLPIFSRMFQEGEKMKTFFTQSLLLVTALSCSVAIGCFFFRYEIMDLLYTNSTDYWGHFLAFLLPTFIFTSGTYVAGTFLTASGELSKLNKLLVVGVILNFSLNLLLIPQYKAVGAAIATLGTQAIMFFFQLEFSRRILEGKIDWGNVVRTSVFVTISVFYCYSISEFSSLNWIINLIIAGGGTVLMSWAMKIIHPEFVQSLMNKD